MPIISVRDNENSTWKRNEIIETLYQFIKDSFVAPSISLIKNSDIIRFIHLGGMLYLWKAKIISFCSTDP